MSPSRSHTQKYTPHAGLSSRADKGGSVFPAETEGQQSWGNLKTAGLRVGRFYDQGKNMPPKLRVHAGQGDKDGDKRALLAPLNQVFSTKRAQNRLMFTWSLSGNQSVLPEL